MGTDLYRIILMYGPASVMTCWVTAAFFPNETGQGGLVSDAGAILFMIGLMVALGWLFYAHMKTRRW